MIWCFATPAQNNTSSECQSSGAKICLEVARSHPAAALAPSLDPVYCCRYVGFGANGHWEPASANACPNFREDLEAYLSTSGSHYRTLQVGTIWVSAT